MIRRPPRSTRTDTLFPYTTLFRSLSIGEVAQRAGVPISTLHFYEAQRLIWSMRTNGNQRRYGRGVLRAIAIIKVASRAGIPLAAIRDRLQPLPSTTSVTAADWAHLSLALRNELDTRIARITRLSDPMSSCIGCCYLSSQNAIAP